MGDPVTVPQGTDRKVEKAKVEKVRSAEIVNQRITSEALFSKRRELVILHEGEEYKLRITANNKLILTK